MKQKLILVLLMVLLAVPAAAQTVVSLKDLSPGESFQNAEHTFSINLPRAPSAAETETENLSGTEKNTVEHYRWILREGVFSISVRTFEKQVQSPILIDVLIAVTANRLEKEGNKIISRRKLEQGGAHGGEIIRKSPNGEKVIFQLHGAGRTMYTLTVSLARSESGAEKRMIEALKSFTVTELKASEIAKLPLIANHSTNEKVGKMAVLECIQRIVLGGRL
jgi:hypothetical protein